MSDLQSDIPPNNPGKTDIGNDVGYGDDDQ